MVKYIYKNIIDNQLDINKVKKKHQKNIQINIKKYSNNKYDEQESELKRHVKKELYRHF